MNAHTPGPWRWRTDALTRGPRKGKSVVTALGTEARRGLVLGPNWSTSQGEVWEAWVSVSEADAALIAAAPELLGALEAVLLFHSSSPWTQEEDAEFNRLLFSLLGREPEASTKGLCDGIRAAIAKARGTS